MSVTPSPFFDPCLTAPQSEVSLSAITQALTDTYAERQAKVDAMQLEVEMLVDLLVNQVRAEKAYHSRMGLFLDRTAKDPYGSTSAPEAKPESRAALADSLTPVDVRLEVVDAPSHPSSVPPVTVGITKAMDLLDTVDRDLRLYSHRVKDTRLRIHRKLLEIDLLAREAAAAPTSQGGSNG
jgi:hypothetical protein